MKKLFIHLTKKEEIYSKLKLPDNLPEKLHIAYTIQYKKIAEQVKSYLKSKKIAGFSQVLGCSEIKTKANAFLFIGDGRFHAINLALSTGKEVYTFPAMNKIGKEEIKRIRNKGKGKYLKFLSAERLGVLVSLKQGQENLREALKLKKQIKQQKRAYIFLADNIDVRELENFSLDIWINTACPGLALDSNKIINSKEIY